MQTSFISALSIKVIRSFKKEKSSDFSKRFGFLKDTIKRKEEKMKHNFFNPIKQ